MNQTSAHKQTPSPHQLMHSSLPLQRFVLMGLHRDIPPLPLAHALSVLFLHREVWRHGQTVPAQVVIRVIILIVFFLLLVISICGHA